MCQATALLALTQWSICHGHLHARALSAAHMLHAMHAVHWVGSRPSWESSKSETTAHAPSVTEYAPAPYISLSCLYAFGARTAAWPKSPITPAVNGDADCPKFMLPRPR